MAKRSRPVKTTPPPAASGVEAPAGAELERSEDREEDQTTVGAALDLGSDAAHPSISMGDDPDVLPENASPEVSASRSPQATSANEGRESMPFPRASEPYDGKPPAPEVSASRSPQAMSASEGKAETRGGKAGKYTQRIRVTEAFQYMGTLKDAPDFIDRSWLARTPRDDRRALPAGPGLKVPTKAGVVYCWPGDYVAVQSYADTGDQELVVWERELFERLFTQASEE